MANSLPREILPLCLEGSLWLLQIPPVTWEGRTGGCHGLKRRSQPYTLEETGCAGDLTDSSPVLPNPVKWLLALPARVPPPSALCQMASE